MAATASFLNPSIVRLELLANNLPLGSATGFFLKFQNQWYLTSNWHVFSGREPNSGQPRDKAGAVPDKIRYFTQTLNEKGLQWKENIVHLNDSNSLSPLWYQHPVGGQDFDIAVLPIEASQIGLAKDILDVNGNDPNMFIDLGHDLFLPGYPLGIASNGAMSIWKRASLASSLEFEHGITHFFYVDTATREGMSGAPCFAISNWRHYSLDRSSNKMKVVENPVSWRFLGVYSGRRNPSDGFEAQIGIVWRELLIFEAIQAQKKGDYVLRNKKP